MLKLLTHSVSSLPLLPLHPSRVPANTVDHHAAGLTKKALVMLMAALLCSGCGGKTVSGPGDILTSEGVVIDGFSEDPCILTSSNIVRVGTYYDFSGYDSLRITFSAARLSTDRAFDEILVRIGPTTYLHDSVYASQKKVSLGINVSRLAKPRSSALSFWTADPQTVLQLSDLLVVGWKSE